MSTCSINGCDKVVLSRSWCGMHYSRWRRNGNAEILLGDQYLSPEERFLAKLNKEAENECWEWTGLTNKAGYGTFKIKGRSVLVHRYSWIYHNDEPDSFDELFVCHKCDNPPCVNPEHLFLGNNSDNISDCVIKFRHHKQSLSYAEITEIKKKLKDGAVQRKLAKEFKVSPATINRISKGVRYGYIDPA